MLLFQNGVFCMRLNWFLILLVTCAAWLRAGDDDVPTLKALPPGALVFTGALKDAAEKMVISPDGSRIAVTGSGSHIQIFSASLKPIKDIDAGGQCANLDFSADGKGVVTSGPGNALQVWDIESGKSVRKFTGHNAEVRAVACSPDGSRLASTDSAGTIRIWDFNEAKLLHTLTSKKYPDDPPTEGITTEGLAFTPDGRFLVTEANDVKARVWDAAQGVELRMVPDHDGTTVALCVSMSGALAASSRSGSILRVWKIDTGEILRSITGHDDELTCSTFCPDDFTVFSGGGDATLRQWDIESGLELRRFKLTAPPSALVCSADGKRVYSLSADAGIVAWSLTGPPAATGKFADSVTSLDTAWQALGSTDYEARSDAIVYLLKYKDGAAAIKFLLDKINAAGADEEARKTQRELIAKLDDSDYAVRLKASEDLKKIGHAARESLLEALKNPSSEVRNKAAELLRGIGGATDGRSSLVLEIFGIMHSPASKDALSAEAAKSGPRAARAKAILARNWAK